MDRPREALPLFTLICVAALVAFGAILWSSAQEGATRVRYEDLALARLRILAENQQAHRERTGRYGWVEDLESAGLLTDVGVEKDPSVGAAGLMYLSSPRYRLDVMLPYRITRAGQAVLALRSEGKRNADLEASHYVLVARPWGDELTGLRTFVLDETGQVYVSEGVSDAAALEGHALPELHPSIGTVIVTGGMRLYPLDDLPLR